MQRLGVISLLAAFAVSACATTPICREADGAERQAFGVIVAGNPGGLADYLPPQSAALADQLRAQDPALRAQIFGQRMGDASVRSVLMQPPMCVYEAPGANASERISYAFPQGRFEALNPEGTREVNLGTPARDHAACRFRMIDGRWQLTDACLSTFRTPAPVG
ncbi:MAG: hypothetical protein JJU26_09440 [Oceanicaulis sp.]|uniref:hypothetical protein n=1 Tax=Glycocaulis sp. TaxID=1969725 RepID=UPI0025C5EFBB|nr:hypothetical protein [Glycocaulis sp.]MCC5981926.1 hypothetical protein [Oceanicaulis sp.]MCH8520887.1 hypothetical protein [Glycocaulis sp.]